MCLANMYKAAPRGLQFVCRAFVVCKTDKNLKPIAHELLAFELLDVEASGPSPHALTALTKHDKLSK